MQTFKVPSIKVTATQISSGMINAKTDNNPDHVEGKLFGIMP